MIERIYRRTLIVVWVLFIAWLVATDVRGQSIFDSHYAPSSQVPRTKLDPIEREGFVVIREVSASLPQKISVGLSQAVIVRNSLGGNRASKGSGVYLGDGLYSSAWHVVSENSSGSIEIEWKDGRKYKATVAGKDSIHDIVLLETRDKPRGGVPVSRVNVDLGHKVYLAGYSLGPLNAWSGKAVERAAATGAPAADWVYSSGAAISGDSGGPVLNETGCYVGPLWGTDGRRTIFSNTGRVQRFLLPWNARLAAWQSQGFGCYGGQGQCPPMQYQSPPPQYQGGSNSGRVPVENNPTEPPTQPYSGNNVGWPSGPPPQQRPQPPQPECECDPEAIADAIRESLGDLRGERGPSGEIGLQGPIGPQGPKGDEGQVSPEQIAAIVEEITKSLVNNPALKGERGPQGERGLEGPRGPGISDISMDENGYVYVQYGVNGRREQIGRLQIPEQLVAGQRSPAYFEIVPKQ